MTRPLRFRTRSSSAPHGSLTLPAIAKLMPALLLAATLVGCATKAQHTTGSLSGKSPKPAVGTAEQTGGAGGGSTDPKSASSTQPGGSSSKQAGAGGARPGRSEGSQTGDGMDGDGTSSSSDGSTRNSAGGAGGGGVADAGSSSAAGGGGAGGTNGRSAGAGAGGVAGGTMSDGGNASGGGADGRSAAGVDGGGTGGAGAAGVDGVGAGGAGAGGVAGADRPGGTNSSNAAAGRTSAGGARDATVVSGGAGGSDRTGGANLGAGGADAEDVDSRVASIDVPSGNVKIDEDFRPQTLGGMLPLVLGVNEEGRFDFDKYALRDEVKVILDDLAAKLKTAEYDRLDIVGYTDRIGTVDYNKRLSELRAYSVAQYLVEQGVPDNKIHYEGRGEKDSLTQGSECTGLARAELITCLQKDRRVEIEASIRRKHATVLQ